MMIGVLPKSLNVGGVNYTINSDYRAALTILEAMNDDDLSELNKRIAMLEILYTEKPNIPQDNNNYLEIESLTEEQFAEAQRQAVWFLNIGKPCDGNENTNAPKTLDWQQDEQFIFSAVNAVTGYDVREKDYMHWWTFCGLCQSISHDALISHIIHIRYKRGKGEKLEKHEEKFYRENQHLVDMKSGAFDYESMLMALKRGE